MFTKFYNIIAFKLRYRKILHYFIINSNSAIATILAVHLFSRLWLNQEQQKNWFPLVPKFRTCENILDAKLLSLETYNFHLLSQIQIVNKQRREFSKSYIKEAKNLCRYLVFFRIWNRTNIEVYYTTTRTDETREPANSHKNVI